MYGSGPFNFFCPRLFEMTNQEKNTNNSHSRVRRVIVKSTVKRFFLNLILSKTRLVYKNLKPIVSF